MSMSMNIKRIHILLYSKLHYLLGFYWLYCIERGAYTSEPRSHCVHINTLYSWHFSYLIVMGRLKWCEKTVLHTKFIVYIILLLYIHYTYIGWTSGVNSRFYTSNHTKTLYRKNPEFEYSNHKLHIILLEKCEYLYIISRVKNKTLIIVNTNISFNIHCIQEYYIDG